MKEQAALELEEPAVGHRTTLLAADAAAVTHSRTKCLCMLCALATALVGAWCVLTRSGRATANGVCLTRSCVRAAAALLESIDRATPPCDDFYAHVCGGWPASHPMPESKASYNTFAVLAERNDAVLRDLLERTDAGAESAASLARAYYAACMDSVSIEGLGARPLAPLLAELSWVSLSSEAAWTDSDWAELSGRLGRLQRRGTMPLFYWWTMADARNSTANVVHLGQSGLGLPSRDYYLDKPAEDPYLRAYSRLLERLLELAAADGTLPTSSAAIDPTRRAELVRDVLAFETSLALASLPSAALRDPAVSSVKARSLRKCAHY